ncbi:sigma-70 family RNA polymerase sigma factor [Paenisporosarcina cavernae]|uniref:Sigma-70 family RNA polymerase sigma factor n=1 Tax=Paenisporosarcina cavernae TaxID=2320858 RepID=A0A385YR06_9BACL|nr:sigma-70 family RNA polymerase sigma factor [Paenisporosarcina cavernae]AYC28427.1 sigma-70 family RNA polymerase sigma factor [Paenisporosarcina cavernae]
MENLSVAGVMAKEKREEILSELMHEYGDDLKRIAFLYLNDLTESEDIMQEVFITCFHQLHTFKGDSSYKTWLIRITINKCKDYKKRWSFRNIYYRKSVPELVLMSYDHSYQQDGELIEFISQLSPKYKEVLILHYYEDMTMNEISKILSLSINTIKSRLLRAKEALHKKLERNERDGSI